MSRDDYRKLITIDPQLRNGEPCIHGWPIKVYEVVSEVIGGATWTQLSAKYPQLRREDILACLIFAAEQPKPLFLLRDEDLWP
ncbi:MAG TPA: DUF433 domain-containing protein [Verrucomicrobiae bacterium]|nr:DUF433 domain-containing protein [Verrucomicrobiae bacterium]